MKKIITVILIIAAVLSLASCTKYKPVKSTDEEAETVLTLSLDGIDYEVPYELYRTFFLNYKSTVDGGNSAVWSGPDKQKYINEIDKLIFDNICDIYSVFHLCQKADIDVFSNIVDQTVEDYIKASIEGGTVDGMVFEGHGGDYDKYLDRLKELNMNYSVQEILFRYAICSELLDSYYLDKDTGEGVIKYTKEDVRAFYDSDVCVRVISHFFSLASKLDKEINTDERIARIRAGILERAGDEDAVCSYIISSTTVSEDVRGGVIIAKYNLEPMYYSELTAAAFALEMYGVSAPIRLANGSTDGVYLLYKAEKSNAHFESYYSSIESAYVQNLIGEKLNEAKVGLLASVEKTDVLKGYNYASISMG